VRAVQITQLTGPETATQLVDVPEPAARSHHLSSDEGVVIDVAAAGVSFPEVLQTRGAYQIKPELPFIPGSEVSGIVRSAPAGAAVRPGDRVTALTALGGFAEVAVAPVPFTFALPAQLDFRQGAGLILNYHTVYFALVTRGRLRRGETVLVHGAAGGVGTAALQVAKALGARTIAVVSTDAKEEVARRAGADHVLRSSGDWREETKALGGADIVLDPVGGDRFVDSLRALRTGGRALVVGFTEGSIPTVKVNRLLLSNIEVAGAGWGAYALSRPEYMRDTAGAIARLIEAGTVAPIVGAAFPLKDAADALKLIDARVATGKVVLEVR
jgi:NADPH2:quinone reductase